MPSLVMNYCFIFSSAGLSNAVSGDIGWGRDSIVGDVQTSKEDIVV